MKSYSSSATDRGYTIDNKSIFGICSCGKQCFHFVYSRQTMTIALVRRTDLDFRKQLSLSDSKHRLIIDSNSMLRYWFERTEWGKEWRTTNTNGIIVVSTMEQRRADNRTASKQVHTESICRTYWISNSMSNKMFWCLKFGPECITEESSYYHYMSLYTMSLYLSISYTSRPKFQASKQLFWHLEYSDSIKEKSNSCFDNDD